MRRARGSDAPSRFKYEEFLRMFPDAVWCESDWPSSVGARVFREASATTEWAALVAGAAVTSLAVLLTNRLDAVARARFKEE